MANNLPAPQPPSGGFLVDLIPVSQRKRVYALYGLVGFVIGCLTVAWAAVGDLPKWVLIASLVWNFAAVPFGALATANAAPTGQEAQQ